VLLLHNRFNSLEEDCVKLFNQVAVSQLFEASAEFPYLFHGHFLLSVKQTCPLSPLVFSGRQGSLAKLLGSAKQVALVTILKFSHLLQLNFHRNVTA
jgi:hypothetical protein